MTPARKIRPRRAVLCGLFLCLALRGEPALQQTTPEPVGRIEGDDIAVRGQVNLQQESGRSFAELTSGSEVVVRSGQARIELTGGGQIGICGPAKFSLLRSGASLTLAVEFGRVHARLENSPALTVYTPLIVATPLAISGAASDTVVGLGENGKLCVLAVRGAVRLQQQFGDQTLVVPQSGEASLSEGQLDSITESPRACRCDALVPKHDPPVRIEAGAPATSRSANREEIPKKADPAPQPVRDQPVWKVIMPPLTFDANAPAPPPPPLPETILLLREVRVEPATVFRGSVAPRAPKLVTAPAPPASSKVGKTEATGSNLAAEKKPGFGTRVRNFFRRLFGGKPKNQQ